MRKRIASIRNHFNRHRFAYGVATGLIVSGHFVMQRADDWNEFLDKHDLFDEFYSIED
jgi:hypothetical protein